MTVLKECQTSILIGKDDRFSYHCTKRIVEEDIFGASIYCTCQCNSDNAYEYLDNVKCRKLLA